MVEKRLTLFLRTRSCKSSKKVKHVFYEWIYTYIGIYVCTYTNKNEKYTKKSFILFKMGRIAIDLFYFKTVRYDQKL